MALRGAGLLVTGLMLAAASCGRRVVYYQSPSVEGLHFFAVSRVTGSARDSVHVRVSARNDADVQRRLDGGVCGDPLAIRAYRAKPGRRSAPVWDSTPWRRATDPPNQVCVSVAILRFLLPGESADVAAFTVPMHVMLGDSLPAGRYYLSARLNNSGWQAGEIAAGAVDLRMP